MPTFLPEATYDRLLNDLAGAFMVAATSTGTDLRDELAKALAVADVLPGCCREGDGLRAVA